MSIVSSTILFYEPTQPYIDNEIHTQSEELAIAFKSGGINVGSELDPGCNLTSFFGSFVFLLTVTPMSRSGSHTVWK